MLLVEGSWTFREDYLPLSINPVGQVGHVVHKYVSTLFPNGYSHFELSDTSIDVFDVGHL
jgi:hypothetical protein